MDFLDHHGRHHHRHRHELETAFGEPPRRVYARVDRFEPDGVGGGWVLHDGVDADWFDEVGEGIEWFADPGRRRELGERVSVVEESRSDTGAIEKMETLEGSWLELGFDEGGPEVQQYLNLFADPVPRELSRARPLDAATEAALIAKTGLGYLPDADPGEIGAVLMRLPPVEAAAVYDVGHGACSALIGGGSPILYFDVGGGVKANTRTFPKALDRFCVNRDPAVVLSHWDWDHWSSAQRDPRLVGRTWIVPRHNDELSPVHAAFLGELLLGGAKVLVWPRELPEISVPGLTVVQCDGRPNDRNNSGLALVLDREIDGEARRMLFPADAAYRHVPGADREFTSVVVPHHGGRTAGGGIPASDGEKAGRLVFSYGAGNSFWHPYANVGREHAAVWKKRAHTAARDERGLGHVHLYWVESEPDARPRCRGVSCDLTCHQR